MSIKSEEEVTQVQICEKLKNLSLRTCQINEPEIANNDVLTRVLQILKDMDYNSKFFEKAVEHFQVLGRTSFENLNFLTDEECLSYYSAKLFYEKMQLLRWESNPAVLENSGLIETMPLQYFLKENINTDAKDKFEKNLKKGDLLFVEMIKNECKGLNESELGKLRIVAKVSDDFNIEHDFVYHLNCIVFMFKNLEMSRLGRNEIKSSEVLKVGILGQPSPNKSIVTTNKASLKLPQSNIISLSLGIVPFEDMPPFLKSFKMAQKFACYAKYLRSLPQFSHCSNLTEQITSLGIDPLRIYSFYVTRDGLTVPPGRSTECLERIAKEAIHNDAQNHLEKAKKYKQKGEFENAIDEFEKCAKCWPDNYKVYELRGKMYLGMGKGHYLNKAIYDFEAALQLNPSAQESKRCLSNILCDRSKRLIKKKKYDVATESLHSALKICPEKEEASALLKQIETQKRLPVEAMDLKTLEKRRESIEKQLKKEPFP